MKRSIAVAALVAVSVPHAALSQCSEADRQALIVFDKAWGDAGPRGDKAFLETVYAANFVGHNPGGPTDRAATIANTMRTFERTRANPQPVTVPDHYMVTCTATTATITHRNVTPPPAGSNDPPSYSRSVHFLEKRGNRWQVVSTAGHELTDAAAIAYVVREWDDSRVKRDASWMENNYASFASEVRSRTGARLSKAETIEFLKSDKTVIESIETSDMNVRVEGSTAVVTGVKRIKGKDPAGKSLDWRVGFTDTLVRENGQWKVWATQRTTIE